MTASQVDPREKGIMGSNSVANRRRNHTIPTESIAQIKTDGLPRTTRPGAGESEVRWILARNLCGEKKYVDGGAGTANRRVAWTPKSEKSRRSRSHKPGWRQTGNEDHSGEGGSGGRRNAESDTTCYTLGRWRLAGDVRETRGSETWDESVRLTA